MIETIATILALAVLTGALMMFVVLAAMLRSCWRTR